jgi:hypothetical protein
MSARSRRRRYEQRKSYEVIVKAYWDAYTSIPQEERAWGDPVTVEEIAHHIPVPKGKNPVRSDYLAGVLSAMRPRRLGFGFRRMKDGYYHPAVC